jgi:FkbM family methyltransferase
MADHRLDGGPAAQFAVDLRRHASFLAGYPDSRFDPSPASAGLALVLSFVYVNMYIKQAPVRRLARQPVRVLLGQSTEAREVHVALGTRMRRRLWRLGWDLHRFRPDYGLDAYLSAFLPGRGIKLVLDVGACNGEYGQLLRGLGYRGRIVSFEPLPKHFEQLKRLAAADGNWLALPYALGDTPGRAEMSIAQSSDLSSFLTTRRDARELFPGAVVDTTATVEVRRLDDIFSTIVSGADPSSIYLKMDTQGFDLQVIRGASASLKHIAAVQSEVSFIPLYEGQPSCADMLAELASLGFSPAGFFVVNRSANGRLIEADCVFLRR